MLSSNQNLHGRVNSFYLHVKIFKRKLRFMSHFAERALSSDSRSWVFYRLKAPTRSYNVISFGHDDKGKSSGEL